MIDSGQDSLIRARRWRWQRGRWRRRRQWGSDRSGWRPGASPRPSPGQALPVGPRMGHEIMLEIKAGGEGAGGAAAKERLAHGSAECGVNRMKFLGPLSPICGHSTYAVTSNDGTASTHLVAIA